MQKLRVPDHLTKVHVDTDQMYQIGGFPVDTVHRSWKSFVHKISGLNPHTAEESLKWKKWKHKTARTFAIQPMSKINSQ